MASYSAEIIQAFKFSTNPENAKSMKVYMRNKFEYLGIKSPERKELSKPFLTRHSLPPTEQIWSIIQELWDLPEREFQYFAMELIAKYKRSVNKEWIGNYENLIISKSWWDTVDFIAATLVGHYFKMFPEMTEKITRHWMRSGNIWLQRTCLIFQLKYKDDVNTELLSSFIKELCVSKEFFITKAIGWSLREYSKRNPSWVLDFVQNNTLQPLSRREAMRLIIKKDLK
jgi:3-methyladenine DNA glycosylase AlkD